jgi:hypothetical protein
MRRTAASSCDFFGLWISGNISANDSELGLGDFGAGGLGSDWPSMSVTTRLSSSEILPWRLVDCRGATDR